MIKMTGQFKSGGKNDCCVDGKYCGACVWWAALWSSQAIVFWFGQKHKSNLRGESLGWAFGGKNTLDFAAFEVDSALAKSLSLSLVCLRRIFFLQII